MNVVIDTDRPSVQSHGNLINAPATKLMKSPGRGGGGGGGNGPVGGLVSPHFPKPHKKNPKKAQQPLKINPTRPEQSDYPSQNVSQQHHKTDAFIAGLP